MHKILPACSFPNCSAQTLYSENGTIFVSLVPGPCVTNDFSSSKNLEPRGFFDNVSVLSHVLSDAPFLNPLS